LEAHKFGEVDAPAAIGWGFFDSARGVSHMPSRVARRVR